MYSLTNENNQETLLDCSQSDEVSFWASQFEVSPQAIKSAVRACGSNSVGRIADYLQRYYLPAQQQAHR